MASEKDVDLNTQKAQYIVFLFLKVYIYIYVYGHPPPRSTHASSIYLYICMYIHIHNFGQSVDVISVKPVTAPNLQSETPGLLEQPGV